MKGIELFVPKPNQALVYRGEKSDDIIAHEERVGRRNRKP